MGNSRLKTHATRPYRKAVHTRHRAGATHLTHTSHARKGGTPQRVRAERETPDARRTYHSSPPHQFVNVTVCERNLLDATLSLDFTTTVSFTRHTPHARAPPRLRVRVSWARARPGCRRARARVHAARAPPASLGPLVSAVSCTLVIRLIFPHPPPDPTKPSLH